ncbi:ABC transporter permease [Steroidobacter sp.]|uniref:ABC transporter permease n=1 Tax=Steroidobacter sp. TaxID=1978227 RepID=UPI001A545995|nr:ABC transporter permease [Steroidobacter sp.]MBL8271077.1 ABC transporter permease [Steroidobacter sp.]
MSVVRQIGSVALVGIATIPKRLGAAAVVVVGIAGVVGVFIGLLAIGEGFERTLQQSGNDHTALILQAGTQSEAASSLARDVPSIVSQAAQIKRNAENRAIVSAELLVAASLRKRSTGLEANVAVRGIGERAWELRPQAMITAGRQFQPGLQELVLGADAHRQFLGTQLGATLMLNGQAWLVVGIFDSGDAHNSEIWTDSDVLGSAFRRGTGKSSLVVQLTDASTFDAFKAQLVSDPSLNIDVITTQQYYSRQSARVAKMSRVFGIVIATIMALGATFGALNTMYAAVTVRAREIATLRAIGFRSIPVVVSVLLETLLLAVAGGVIGAGIAWLLFDGLQASTMGSSGGQIMFAFEVSAQLLASGVIAALAIGLVGGLLPAIRAARMPIAMALREL